MNTTTLAHCDAVRSGRQPTHLAYVRELTRVAGENGAALAEESWAIRIARDGAGWVTTAGADLEIRSRFVVVATNAQSDDLIPGLARTLIPLQSFQIATEPLSSRLLAEILPGEQAVSDSRRILVY